MGKPNHMDGKDEKPDRQEMRRTRRCPCADTTGFPETAGGRAGGSGGGRTLARPLLLNPPHQASCDACLRSLRRHPLRHHPISPRRARSTKAGALAPATLLNSAKGRHRDETKQSSHSPLPKSSIFSLTFSQSMASRSRLRRASAWRIDQVKWSR